MYKSSSDTRQRKRTPQHISVIYRWSWNHVVCLCAFHPSSRCVLTTTHRESISQIWPKLSIGNPTSNATILPESLLNKLTSKKQTGRRNSNSTWIMGTFILWQETKSKQHKNERNDKYKQWFSQGHQYTQCSCRIRQRDESRTEINYSKCSLNNSLFFLIFI